VSMPEQWIRGNFFQQTLEYVKRVKGPSGLEAVGKTPEDYKAEHQYDFVEFCELLIKIKKELDDQEGNIITRIARETMTSDTRWQVMFRRLDPKDIFSSTKRQASRHQIGEFVPVISKKGHVTLRMTLWSENEEHQDLWAKFYKGRLEGILELTGHKGTVEVEGGWKAGSFTYVIEWN